MSYLRCNARNCAYNQDELCSRNGIRVDGATADCKNETCCNSFAQKSDSYSNSTAGNSTARPETEIDCDVCKCSYNKDCKCHASSVDISGSGACHCRETQCSTFDCKKSQ